VVSSRSRLLLGNGGDGAACVSEEEDTDTPAVERVSRRKRHQRVNKRAPV
jgi:hypothetical protein